MQSKRCNRNTFRYKFCARTTLLLDQALIKSTLNYLLEICGSKNNSKLEALQRLQNKALRIVFNLPIVSSPLPLNEGIA